MVIGRERIERLRHSNGVNQVERGLIEQIRRRNQVRIVLFRAMNDHGERVWRFGSDLDDDAMEDGGLVMTNALLPLHRRGPWPSAPETELRPSTRPITRFSLTCFCT